MKKLNKFTTFFTKYSPKTYIFLSSAVTFSFPFGLDVLNKIALLWVLFGFFSANFKENFIEIKKNKSFLLFIILNFSLIFLYCVGILYSENKNTAIENISHSFVFIIITIVISANYKITTKNIKQILFFFVSGNIITSIICFLLAFYNSISISEGNIIFQSSIKEGYSFFQSIVGPGNYFFYSDFSYFLHTSYSSILIVFSIAILLYYKEFNNSKAEIKYLNIFDKKIIRFSLIIFLSITVLLFSSKANFLALILIYFLYFLFSNFKKKYIFLLLIALLSISLLTRNSRFNIYFENLNTENSNIENSNENIQIDSQNSRIYIWKSALEVSIENIFFGVGTGDAEKELIKKYQDKKFKFLEENKYNAHNVFLEIFMQIGIFGLLIFISIFIFSSYKSILSRDKILFSFLIVTFSNFLFESMLNRLLGVIFWSFFIILLNIDYRNIHLNKLNIKHLIKSLINENHETILFLTSFTLYFIFIKYYFNFSDDNQLIVKSWFAFENFNISEFKTYPSLSETIIFLLLKIFANPSVLWIKLIYITILSFINIFILKILKLLYQNIDLLIFMTILFLSMFSIFKNTFIIEGNILFSFFFIVGIYLFTFSYRNYKFKKNKFIYLSTFFIIISLIILFENINEFNKILSLDFENPLVKIGLINFALTLLIIFIYKKISNYKIVKFIYPISIFLFFSVSIFLKVSEFHAIKCSQYQTNSFFGIIDEKPKVENFNEMFKKIEILKKSEKQYFTNISILPYLLNSKPTNKTQSDESLDFMIFEKSKNFLKSDTNFYEICNNDNFIVFRNKEMNFWTKKALWHLPEEGAELPLEYSFYTEEHGKYTVSADLKFHKDDSTFIPRISIYSKYSDGTIEYVKDSTIYKDNILRHYNISLQTDTTKKLVEIYGWILDHSGVNGKKHVDVENIRISFIP